MAAGIVAGFLVAAGFVVFIVLGTLFNGYVLSIVWNWFMPALFGLPQLSVPYAMAVELIAHHVTYQYNEAAPEKEGSERFVKAMIATVLRPLIFLGVAWCIRQFL